MTKYPQKLQAIVDEINSTFDRNERIQFLIEYSEKYEKVSEEIANKPYPEENRVEYCESDAYVWTAVDQNKRVQLYFAVENPSGISAKALAAILSESLNGEKAETVFTVNSDIVFDLFGNELSMGKNLGLTGIVNKIKHQLTL
ncbi:MAG: SufE family protein [Melioribacteraceae bacterium]|nr:SufE family protein [Melioribacteraceae bacterium]